MARWNPNAPSTLGMEYLPTTQSSAPLDALAKSIAMAMDQSTAQAIGKLKFYVPSESGLDSTIIAEVFDGANAGVTLPVTKTSLMPNEDVSGTGTGSEDWKTEANSGSNVYAKLQTFSGFGARAQAQTSLLDSSGLFIETDTYVGRLNAGSGAFAGRRILAVEMQIAACWVDYPAGFSAGLLGHANLIGGTGTPGEGAQIGYYPGGLLTATALYSKDNRRPWRIADIDAFDTGNGFYFVAMSASSGGPVRTVWVDYVGVNVYHVQETRLAFGGEQRNGTAPAWVDVDVATPTGGTWTKDGSGQHIYVLRDIPAEAGARISVNTLLGDSPTNPAQGYDVTTDPSYGEITAMGALNGQLFPMIQRTTAPADSVDSQPYVNMIEALAFFSGAFPASQQFSGASTASYGLVRALVKCSDDTSFNLTVTVHKVSDNSQVGGSVSVTPATVRALPDAGNGWKYVEMLYTSSVPSLVSGTRYYLQFDSDETQTATAWRVLALDTLNEANLASYGGTTDGAWVNDSGFAARYSLAATISITPSAPANLTLSTSELELGGECATCNVDAIEYTHVFWSATSLSGSFGYYELQRQEPSLGNDWATIATIATEATHTFDDIEGPRGIQSCYRVRVVTNIGIPSPWATQVCNTVNAKDCELILVSNQDLDLGLAYQYPQERTWEFLDAAEVVFQQIYERDYQLAFQPTEHRGVRTTMVLSVSCIATTGQGGLAQWDALRALSEADLPYVVIMDQYGNRIYALLQVATGTQTEPGARYVAEVTVTEIAGEPTAVEL